MTYSNEKPISEIIRDRLEAADEPYHANDNISKYINDNELDLLQAEVEDKLQGVLESLVIDTDRDHNTQETAKRVAKMYIREVFSGRYIGQPKITDFPNAKDLDQVYTVGPITVRSACSHHLVPIMGNAWIGIKPSNRVIGISKFNRLTEWVFSRPHIQEEGVVILADEIERLVKPKGLIVIVKADHYCMKWRGVREPDCSMVTSVVRGEFRNKPHMKQEFLNLIGL